MASWMVHLRVADKLYNIIENLSEKEFIVGNIAPDSGEQNVDSTVFTPSRDISHFITKDSCKLPNPEKFYREYIRGKELERKKYSFYLGYYCHLLTDMFWEEDVYTPIKQRYRGEILNSKNLYKSIDKDCYDLDHMFLINHPSFRSYKILKDSKNFVNEYLGFFSNVAIFNRIKYICDYYDKVNDNFIRQYHYVMRVTVDNFVDSVVEKIYARIKHEWDDIRGSRFWKKVEPLSIGWSYDRKYFIETFSGTKMLLRLSDRNSYIKKKKEFEVLKQIKSVSFANPIEIGFCKNNSLVYSLYKWLDGDVYENTILYMNTKDQYKLGFMAGENLKKLHNLDISKFYQKQNWSEVFNKKLDRNIRFYCDCEIRVEGIEKFIKFINKNRNLIINRPQTFLHGDYHLENMLVNTKSKKISIIDFNKYSYGDPYQDFSTIIKSVLISPKYAKGQIDGYFNGEVPDDFFKISALYIANYHLASLPWTVMYGDEELAKAIKLTQRILEWYGDFQLDKPKWYISN